MRIKEEKNAILISDGCETILYDAQTRKMFVADKSIEEVLEEVVLEDAVRKKICIDSSLDEVETIVINCTECCNLKCKYCYVNQGTYNSEYKMMDNKVYSKLIENYFNINKNGVKTIHFFGGEPLMDFVQIKNFSENLTKLCLEHNIKPPVYTMTTNGTLFTEEMMDFFEKYKFMICVSLDGPKEINDKERISDTIESVYDVVREKMELFRGRDMVLSCEATLSMTELSQMSKEELWNYFDFFNSLPIGLVAVFIAKEKVDMETDVYAMNVQKFYDVYIDYVLQAISDNREIVCYKNIIMMIEKIMVGGEYYTCGAGTKHIFLSAGGDVYPCQVFYSARNQRMGNIDNIDEVMAEIDRKKCTSKCFHECEKCNFSSFCSICTGVNVMSNSDEMIVDKESCLETKILVSTLLWKITKLASEPEKYLKFSANLQRYVDMADNIYKER